jgi:hypothetical protein
MKRTTLWGGDEDWGSKFVAERRKGVSSQVEENKVGGSGARTAGAGDVRLAVPQYLTAYAAVFRGCLI